MNAARSLHELITIALGEARDVVTLRRCTQAVCRATGVTGTPLVRLTTVVSEAGEHLLGTQDLTAELCLEESDAVAVAVRFRWREERRPSDALLAAAARLLDATRLEPVTDNGRHELVLCQRAPAPAGSVRELAADVRERLAGTDTAADLIDALRTQNRQLLAALEESERQHEELQRLNAELEETNAGVMALYSELTSELQATNSGVVALYAELEDKTRQLEVAHESKTRFWANVSHELRSPVNSVISLARLLLDAGADPLSDEQRQQVALVQASGSTLLALVDELLDVAKAESGRLEPHPVDTDLRSLLHQLRGTLRGTAQPGVALHIPDESQWGPLLTDEVMLTRILRNVLSNALKFTAEGSVTLTVTEVDGDSGPRFVFRVQDTGVGVPADELDRVFEEFYQVRGPHQRGRAGTGLGLPYARRLTQLLGGSLTLGSEVGVGTTVVVDIPALSARPMLETTAEPAATVEPAPAAPAYDSRAESAGAGPGLVAPDVPRTERGGPPEPSPHAAVNSVVVVDDDETFVAGFRTLLTAYAGSVTVVTDSALAVGTVERERPDIVFLDLNMPGTDGYEVSRLLAANPATARVPVVVLTALEPADVDRTRLAQVRLVLNKSRLTSAGLAAAVRQTALRPPQSFAIDSPAPPRTEERR
ncbi:ATP-binding protein [Streptomyces sp. PanSC9]|uniref:ATP-binding protein n=1 Tax=Streptomyces sp. PanSC9 TaxID=1520461 RepID=UPI000F490554|nr:ATP-binding protein [Streptomyces sp. PanSC9]ROP47658.1 signal transduction histidine kinase [Streptomyces sp. PanSC9]